jgi:hypothetical protein
MMLPAVLGVSEPIIRTRVRIVSPYPYPLPYPYTEQDGGGAYSGQYFPFRSDGAMLRG